jgi:hypothetical protein
VSIARYTIERRNNLKGYAGEWLWEVIEPDGTRWIAQSKSEALASIHEDVLGLDRYTVSVECISGEAVKVIDISARGLPIDKASDIPLNEV